MATRKAPTGPKHDRCIGHVEHPYPAKGVLCFGEVIGEDGMIAFADHLATVRAEHRATDTAEREAMHLAARPGSPETRKASRKRVKVGDAPTWSNAAPAGSAHVSRTPADTAALAELVARFAEMRGRAAIDAASVVIAEREMRPVRKARPVAPVVAEQLAETPAPDTYAAAVELAETRPDPCEACGHPAHGATCASCDDAAQVGVYAPCAFVAPVQALVEPDAEPAPVLSALAPVSVPAERPTCPRCGQSFRVRGSGLAWHVANRPDCARVAVAV